MKKDTKKAKESSNVLTNADEEASTHAEPNNKYLHYEDLAMKTAMQYFGEEILPFLGIEGTISMAVPTESVHLEMKQMFEDYITSWKVLRLRWRISNSKAGMRGLRV